MTVSTHACRKNEQSCRKKHVFECIHNSSFFIVVSGGATFAGWQAIVLGAMGMRVHSRLRTLRLKFGSAALNNPWF
jgi:hypothetical protein